MSKVLKRVLLGIGGFVLLLVAAVVILLVVIDPNDYRGEISEMAYKATGRKIELKGDIGLKIFPRLAFSVKDVNLAQAEGFEGAPLAHVDELGLNMALFPLLKGRAEVDAISLDGLTLILVTGPDGKNNWDVPAKASGAQNGGTQSSAGQVDAPSSGAPGPQSSGSAPPEVEPTADADEAQKRMEQLVQSRINSVEISNCNLSYTDLRTKEYYIGRINKLSLGNVGLNRDITCVLDVAAETDDKIKAGLKLDGQAKYDVQEKLITFNFKSFSISAEAPQLKGRQELGGNLKGSLDGKNSSVKANLGLSSGFLNGNADIELDTAAAKGTVDFKSNPAALLNALSPAMQKELGLGPELLDAKGPLRSLDIKLAFNAAGKAFTVNTAELRLGGSELVASIPSLKGTLDNSGAVANAEGSVSLAGNLRPFLPLAGIVPKGDAMKKLDSAFNFKLAGENLTLSSLKLKLDDTLLDVSAKRADVRLKPAGPLLPINSLKADLAIKAKPRKLMDALNIKLDTADSKVLAELETSLGIEVTNSSLKLSGLTGRLDDTSLSGLVELLLPGAAGIPKGSTSYAKVDLELDSINLDRYLAPEAAGDAGKGAAPAESPTPAGKSSASSRAPLKGTPLEKASGQFTASIKNLTINKIPVQNIKLNSTLTNGVFEVKQAAFNTFDGAFNMSAKANLVNAQAQNSLAANLKGLDLGKALATVLNEKRLSGKAEMNMDFTFKGVDTESILSSLNGKGNAQIKDGVLKDFQLIPADAPELLRKHRLSDYHFSDLGGTFTVVNGKLVNNDLGYKDKNMSLTGKGSVTLVNRHVDYTGVLKTKETGEIPLRIQGPLSSLKITLDQDAIAKMALEKAKEKAVEDLQKKGVLPPGETQQERRQAIEQEVNEKISKEIGRGLNKLFKK